MGACRPNPSEKGLEPLVVGMDLSYPPFETIGTDGRPTGISVEIASALAKEWGRPLRIENISFPGLIPSLNSGKVDLVLSSMTATEERRKSVDFSDPYLSTGLCLLVGKEGPIESISDADQPGKTIAVCRGTTGELYAMHGIHHAKVLVLDRENQGVMEVVQGKADAFIYDQMSTWKNAEKFSGQARAILEPFQKEEWAIAFRKGNDTLRERTNQFLRKFRDEGGFDRLGDEYLSDQKEDFKKRGISFYF